MLEQSKALGLQEELQIPEGRVRLQAEEQQFEQQDDNESVSSRRLSDFESDVFAMLHCQRLKDLTNCKHLPEDKPLENFSKHLPLLPYAHCFHAQEDDTQELWYKMSGLCPGFYPLKKDARPMTKQELTDNKIEVRQAKLKELSSWVKQSAGKPKLRSEYRQRTNLDPIPSRWVEVWKFKQGKRIIRIRLVLKGFAERNQETLQTSSPTSSRIGHRLIYSKAAKEGWEIWSIDVSSAFLRGYKFEELEQEGHHYRQPVAFLPPDPELFSLLAELEPGVWDQAARNPTQFCIEVEKGAYGLKDAPLLWYLKLNKVSTSVLKLCTSKHDVCMFYKYAEKINLLFTLHIDDTLITGDKETLTWFAAKFEEAFEGLTIDRNHFRHCGVDVYRSPELRHIYCDQTDYISQLEAIDLKGKGKATDTASAELITSYRSLVSGIAWLGVTYAPASAGASLYQGFLPFPLISHCHMLNNFLEQLKELYAPLIYHHGLQSPHRLVVLSDSSFANTS